MVRIVSAVILSCLFAACSEKQPPEPPEPQPPDTTSHDWEFTMYEVGGMNTTFKDVCALSPDYAIAVGKIEEDFTWPDVNAYLWNGSSVDAISLPISPHDTVTIDPQNNERTRYGWGSLAAIWAFRRDNLWYTTIAGAIAHMTIKGVDTSVRQETYQTIGDDIGYSTERIWAFDTSTIFFGGSNGRAALYWRSVWEYIPVTTTGDAANVRDLFGTGPENLFATLYDAIHRGYGSYRYDGVKWTPFWLEGYPSLSNVKEFGLPNCYWGDPSDDSIWIAGLWLGRMPKDGKGSVRFVAADITVLRIRGSARNNVFFCGYNGCILHFNGATLKRFRTFEGMRITLNAIACLKDDVFIVGDRYFGGGIIIHGRRIR